ncbi:TRAP transporter substrate-binding protein [Ralstonia soli]|uniref:TRAP transporter substrate-binding protein n=1 Tax=Ralstonia soli TaxID=2953896 RepID=A0ABT1AEB8_9RALS|nr:TRAP transporter substrate-binding protein [Ralstonia soli]MCO5396735.1 TRAP transporter substrate-binding protein [Ralstonia soli]
MDRRHFVKGLSMGALASATLPIARIAQAAEFTFKIAHSTPTTHPLHIRLIEAAAKIKADTKGRFDLQVFPSDQLGAQPDVLGQVRSGATDFFALSGVVLSTLVPAAAISGIGFAFKDYETVWKAMDGNLGAFIRSEIDKTGSLFAFEKIWDNGYRQITSSNRPVSMPSDLAGMKIRVPPSAMWVSLFKALGSSPTTISANELYSSLQTKVVDAQENPLAVVLSFRLYEVQKYCALTNHMWDGFWILANRKNFDTLPPEVQSVVRKHLNDAAVAERKDLAKLNVSSQEQLIAKGMHFTTPKTADFKEKLRAAGYYAQWKNKFPAAGWAQLESVVGQL